jgi:hypothetical protein
MLAKPKSLSHVSKKGTLIVNMPFQVSKNHQVKKKLKKINKERRGWKRGVNFGNT